MKNYCSLDDQPKLDCIHCKQTKPSSNFKIDRNMKNGRMRMCYDCYNRIYRKPKGVFPPIKHLPNEKWRFVSELGNAYKISNKGRLMSLNYNRRGYPVIMELPLDKGYHRINIKNNNWPIHRLVAKYFVPNPNNKPEVNHINGIKNDNRAENLEWCTSSENQKHAFETGLQSNVGEKHSRAKITNKQAAEIKVMLAKGFTVNEIVESTNSTISIVRSIKENRRWTHIKI